MAIITDVVRPGDVITAELLNRIIGMLNAHDALISAGPSPGTGLSISRFVPAPPFSVGQAIEIQGASFGFSTGSTTLSFDGTQVNAFRLGSSDTSLLVQVPQVAGLGTGKDVLLLLSNGSASVTRTVRVNPAQLPQQGNVDVLWNDLVTPNPNPNPAQSGAALTIAYSVKSRATLPATLTIGVQCSNTPMQAAAQVLDGNQADIPTRQLDLGPGQSKGFFIRFPTVTVPSNTAFTVTVSATAPGVSGSDTRVLTVDQVVAQPDPTIGIAFNALTAVDPNTGMPDPNGGNYTAGDNTVHLKQGAIGRLALVATFTQIGTYDVTVEALSPTTQWTVVPANTPAQYQVAASDFSGGVATKNPEIGIQAQAGSSLTGQCRLTLQRQGASQKREITFNLALIP